MTWLRRVVALGAGLVLSVSAQAAPFLAVDYGFSDSQEDGFVAGTSTNQTIGSYQVTVGPNADRYERPAVVDNGAFTYGALYKDFVYSLSGTSLDFTVTGVTAGTYDVRVYAYDYGEPGGTVTFAPTSGSTTSGTTGQVTWVGGALPPSNYAYSTVLQLTTSNNVLSFTASAPAGNILRIPGFEVSAVPEPATLAVVAIGGLFLAARRRR